MVGVELEIKVKQESLYGQSVITGTYSANRKWYISQL